MATLTVKPSNTLGIKIQRVKKAYLAKKEIKGTEKTGETESYTFKGSNNTSTKTRKEKIATIIYKNIKGGLQKKQQQTTVAHIVEVLKKDSYTKGDCIDIPLTLPKIEFTKLANANLGDEVYMVVETENMANKRIKLSLKQAEKDCLVAKDSSIVLQQDGKKTSVVETYVSRFTEQNKKNISNAEDFRNFAIDAVTLSPKEEKDQKKYREALNKTTDKKTKLFMVVDAEPENQNWLEVKYEEIFDNRPNFWYYGDDNWFELKDNSTLEYNIYSDGKIEKTKISKPQKVIYYYYDSNNKKHTLGEAAIHKTKRHVKKDVISTKEDYILLAYSKDIKEYSSGAVKFAFSSWNSASQRWYINPDCFAGLIGAMIEESIEDLGFNGFSIKNGNTAGGSSSHINGEKGDLRYLSTNKNGERTVLQDSHFDYERQVKFNNALYKFGWGRKSKMYSENFDREVEKEVLDEKTKKKVLKKVKEETLLPHTKHMKKTTGNVKYRHHHHLHLTGFDFSKIKEI
ncbi:hypothetical protein [Tenacibaculum discolor]|uniref:hypothetical protein n=1 Tax=Tenacibaculum discolor TaxID=361581 RepID=UPI000EB27FA7|nr:hypothetical protein [Tenacibaculum discolor]RLJ98638.1 hypothetical protein C8N27_2541 [Tenacibaculum discolor]